ncbi:MAG TPA: NADP-dependent oxidoreductase [Euzebyales bacterium]|nr:NADP-dependent oxidoreductase [Euzebyales bacterium]
MRAIVLDDFSSPPRLRDLPTPTPGPDEVLVRVQASSINGFDAAVAAGWLQGIVEHRFPVVMGKDFAGTVEATGDAVTRFAVGDTVFGVVMKPYVGDGGLGEYVTVGEQYGIARAPHGLDLNIAGALGLAGTAARDTWEAVAPAADAQVLISGATGGVGAIAVQYAASAGARVIATARPGAATDFVRELGADHVVDYTADLDTQVRAIAPEGVPAIIHLAGDLAHLAGLLAARGRMSTTLGFATDQLSDGVMAVNADPSTETLTRLAADAARGLRVPITRSYALADAPQALTDFTTGKLGKLAVTI